MSTKISNKDAVTAMKYFDRFDAARYVAEKLHGSGWTDIEVHGLVYRDASAVPSPFTNAVYNAFRDIGSGVRTRHGSATSGSATSDLAKAMKAIHGKIR